MSDQETAVVRETTEIGVEERPELAASEPSSGLAEAEIESETSQSSDASSPTQPEESAESTSSEEAEATTDTTAEAAFDESISIHTLKARQHFSGKVKNITGFGAFVDIGLAQDGLVHISELSRQKVDKVTDVVSEGQEVDVWVKKVDKKRGRISLTMVKPITHRFRDIREEDEFEGVVTRLEPYGAFIDIDSDREGLVHISQITHDYIKHPEDALAIGDKVNVKVIKINRKKRQVDLSIKALLPPPAPEVPEVVEAVKVGPVSEIGEPVKEEESVPTAMALAYAAFQGEESQAGEQSTTKDLSRTGRKRKKEMDAIVARTLAAREE
jgi:predicted RNA-binding protein with RPS1 domain